MAWHILPAHYVAHLNPTLGNSWAAQDGYPIENVNTLNERIGYRTDSASATGALTIEFDRGHTNGAGINCVLILNNTMRGPGHGWTVEAADNATFTTNPTTLINSDTTEGNNIYLSFASNTQRYIRLQWDRTSGAGFQIGCVTFCKSFQVATTGPQISSERHGARFSMQFPNITRANAELIMNDYNRHYIANVEDGTGELDALGAWGGALPVAVVDDVTGAIYWGTAKGSLFGVAANYVGLSVDMERSRQGVLE